MFDRLTDGFQNALKNLSGKGAISEKNVADAMDQVRDALLEADVHYDVAKDFCAQILQDSVGAQVTKSLEPGQEMIGIVNRRLIEFLGGNPDQPGAAPGEDSGVIMQVSPGPTVVMMSGLQGSGKTTTCGKLAGWLKKRGRSVMLCAADLQRPAAVEQLQTVAEQANQLPGGAQVSFYSEPDKVAEYGQAVGAAITVCRNALKKARDEKIDVLILDTAGRLHVNDELMGELKQVQTATQPHHVFLVVDAMTGQDAVNSAKSFHERLAVDGVILTKFDSDTRGGAALSVKKVTGAPIRFIGVGEHLDQLEAFHAERMAGRILGMGDVVSLVEKAQEQVSEEDAEKLQAKMAKGEMDMDDFLKQLKMLRRMGSMRQVLGMLPGVGSALKDVNVDEGQLDRTEAMINSMTKQERKKPDVVNMPRRRRIAKGSASEVTDVGQLVKQFGMLNKMSKVMGGMSGASKAAAVEELGRSGGMGAMLPGVGGLPGMSGKGSTKGKGKSFKSRKKRR